MGQVPGVLTNETMVRKNRSGVVEELQGWADSYGPYRLWVPFPVGIASDILIYQLRTERIRSILFWQFTCPPVIVRAAGGLSGTSSVGSGASD